MIIYWTKEGRFETDHITNVPFSELHSPNEEIPAYVAPKEYNFVGIDFIDFRFEGKKHRLTGPAKIWSDGYEEFWLNGIEYDFEDWIKNHPNLDIYLEANGYKTNEEKILWKLKYL